MRAIKEILYIIALLSSGGMFGFFLAERALTSVAIQIEDFGKLDLVPLIESTLSSSQFAIVVLGLPLSIIAAILVQLAMRDPRGRWTLVLALLGFAGVTGITLYFNTYADLPENTVISTLMFMRLMLSGVSLIAVGYAFRANGREHFR